VKHEIKLHGTDMHAVVNILVYIERLEEKCRAQWTVGIGISSFGY